MVKIRYCSVPSKEACENTIQKMLERGRFASQLLFMAFQWKQQCTKAPNSALQVTESHTVVRVKAGSLPWPFVPNLSIIWRSAFKHSVIRKSSVISLMCLSWAQNEMGFAKGTVVVLLAVYLQVCLGRWIFLNPFSYSISIICKPSTRTGAAEAKLLLGEEYHHSLSCWLKHVVCLICIFKICLFIDYNFKCL